MLTRDLADSPMASHSDLPSSHCDSLRDYLADAFAGFMGPLPATLPAFRAKAVELLDAGLRDADEAGVLQQGQDSQSALVAFLTMLSKDPDRGMAMRSVCYLRLLGVEGRSLDKIGDDFGVVRATVHAVYRALQKLHPGFRNAADKPEAYREDCRARRTGQRKAGFDWLGKSLWLNPIPLPHPL